ncbi:MAG: GNAT family protein [Porphyromonadaceae bacterium]|nr:GNAT family protein [Porphyromonadaceae bacterium]
MNINFELREWRLTDSASLAENANNINIWNNLRDYFPYPYTENDAVRFIEMCMNKPKPATDFAIVVENKAVGGIGIILQNDVERITAEIGYWLGEGYRGRGIMPEAVKQMVTYAFETFSLQKIFASVFDFNTASHIVLQKAGFELEAILKKAAIKNNKIIDLHYYSLFKTK